MVASSSSTTHPAGDSPANACGERGAASADLLSVPIARRKKVSDSDPHVFGLEQPAWSFVVPDLLVMLFPQGGSGRVGCPL